MNYLKYRELVTAEQKRAADRDRIAAKRTAERGQSQSVAECRSQSGPLESVADVAYAEADGKADGEGNESKSLYVERERSTANEPDDPIERIFDHWRSMHQHPKAVLDKKRRALIREAVKNYGEQALKDCISGYKNSPHHAGINDRNTKYDTIDGMLKDAKHIDMGLKFFASPPGRAAPAKEMTAEDREWQLLRDDAAREQFRQPLQHELLYGDRKSVV